MQSEPMTNTPEQPLVERGWFRRHADARNPKAFIRTDPAYFAQECAAAIMNGTLVIASDEVTPAMIDAAMAEYRKAGTLTGLDIAAVYRAMRRASLQEEMGE